MTKAPGGAAGYQVAVVLGSDSDWEVMESCVQQLRDFGVAADVNVLSAHRAPADLHEYVQRAPENGVAVFIAAAGLSAALAGTIAAHTTLPVIGVPVASGTLGGLDALLATAQMPPGVPVACMAIGKAGARNAAVLAVQILAIADPGLAPKLAEFKRGQVQHVRQRSDELRRGL